MLFCSPRTFIAPDSPCDFSYSPGTRRGSFQFEMCAARHQMWLACEPAPAAAGDLQLNSKGRPQQVSPVSVSDAAAAASGNRGAACARQARVRTPSDDDFHSSSSPDRVIINCTCSACRKHRSDGHPDTAEEDVCTRPSVRAKTSFTEAMKNPIVDFGALLKSAKQSQDSKRGRSKSFLTAVSEDPLPKAYSKVKHRLSGKRDKGDVCKRAAKGPVPASALGVPILWSCLSASTSDLSQPSDGEAFRVSDSGNRRKSHSWHGLSLVDRPHEVSYHSRDWQTTGFAFLAPLHAFTAPDSHETPTTESIV